MSKPKKRELPELMVEAPEKGRDIPVSYFEGHQLKTFFVGGLKINEIYWITDEDTQECEAVEAELAKHAIAKISTIYEKWRVLEADVVCEFLRTSNGENGNGWQRK
jgi:hypothetical protein